APLDVGELIESVPESLALHLPSLRYCLIDEKRLPLDMLESLRDNVVAGIARVEQDHGAAHLMQMVERFARWLESPEQNALRRDVLAWLSKVVLPARVPGAEVPELRDLEEFKTYLEVKMQPWTEQWRDEGREEGRREGERLGNELFLRLMTGKFGSLDTATVRRIQAADTDQLLDWSSRLLASATIDEVFAGAEP
ncbi:MAG: hypothetical protein AAF560_19050, partial [Acidobacteriota bacterium]